MNFPRISNFYGFVLEAFVKIGIREKKWHAKERFDFHINIFKKFIDFLSENV